MALEKGLWAFAQSAKSAGAPGDAGGAAHNLHEGPRFAVSKAYVKKSTEGTCAAFGGSSEETGTMGLQRSRTIAALRRTYAAAWRSK